MSFADNTGGEKQPYKYNGKEEDTRHGLNLYDYLARQYDGTVPRFTSIDPHAENYYSWSPYAYCGNNPILNIDPNGKDYWSTSDPDLIRQFINSMGSGTGVRDMFSWTHVADKDFLAVDRFTINDETGKAYTSYASLDNGIPTTVGVSFDTKIKPSLGADGMGYSGAFVYKYGSQLWQRWVTILMILP